MTIEIGYIRRGRTWDVISLTQGGRNDVAEFIDSLPRRLQVKIVRLFDTIAASGDGPFAFKNAEKMKRLDQDLYELKADQVRLLFFVDRPRRAVVTNGFLKRTRRTPVQAIERAERVRALYYREVR